MKHLCKNCGCISDNPEITGHPDKDKEFRVIQDNLIARAESIASFYTGDSHWQEAWFASQEAVLKFKYNYTITCPVCGRTTAFWRDEPFPTDVPKMSNKDKGKLM